MFRLTTLVSASLLAIAPAVLAGNPYAMYDNDFLDPAIFLSKNWSTSTRGAQESIVEWADYLDAQGPWSVTNKSYPAPSGSKHDYMSWAPYFWPDCSSVHNTTEIQPGFGPGQLYVTCPYVNRDGQINPDRDLVTDQASFASMADAILYSSIAWVITGNSKYSANVVRYINVWFLDPDTAQTPNLNYAQMARGPQGQVGQHTGLLDFRAMAKITTGILVLRGGKAAEYTTAVDTALMAWMKNYIQWVQTSSMGIGELTATNNHGTFAFNQLAAMQVLVGDNDGAKKSLNTFFTTIYPEQIDATGEQPLEAARTHPYHYRTYNLEALIVNARIAQYIGVNYWHTPTAKGANIQNALDWAIKFPVKQDVAGPTPDGPVEELYPAIASVAAIYGDPGNKYATFLANANSSYPAEPYFLWNQPLSDSGLAAATPTGTVFGKPTSSSKPGKSNGAGSVHGVVSGLVTFATLTVFTTLMFA